MPFDLDAFLARHEPGGVQTVEWGTAASPIPLRIAGYLSQELPPLEYVASVRGVVFCRDRVLVMRNRDEVHVLPGGQREGDETLVETLQREVLEEAGWTVEVGGMLGFLHLRHLVPVSGFRAGSVSCRGSRSQTGSQAPRRLRVRGGVPHRPGGEKRGRCPRRKTVSRGGAPAPRRGMRHARP